MPEAPEETTSGRDLSRSYWHELVAPLLERRLPGVPLAAARLGSGSDVLGFDDAQSRDHDWGLRLTLLSEAGAVAEVGSVLAAELPETWRGLPTRFATTWDPAVRVRAEVTTVAALAHARLGLDPLAGMAPRDWLSLTGQSILEITAGPVFHDGIGELRELRSALAWYPRDLWWYVLGCGWSRLGQEFPDVGRAGLAGEDTGSAVIAARHVRTVLHLAHLVHRRWAPYGKWLARSAAQLPGGAELRTACEEVLAARSWQERQQALARAVEVLAAQQDAQGLPTLLPATEPFFDRPHLGVRPIPEALYAAIEDPAVQGLPRGHGSAEQISDNVTVLVDHAARRRLLGPAGEVEPR